MVFFVIALVIALVIGLGVWKLNRSGEVMVVEAVPTPRITSYNVCYTKLLR